MYNHHICSVFAIVLFLISNLVLGAPRNFKVKTTASSRWSDAGHTIGVRYFHEVSSLTIGKILFTGGYGYDYCATTEFYYPSTGKWTAGTYMNDCRWYHTSSLLKNGKVLVAGGYIANPEHVKNVQDTLGGAELFDPTTGGWTRTSSLHQQRFSHTASVLPNGKVLVVGGDGDVDFLNSAELYDSSTGNWSITASMHWKRVWHTAITLANGKVLVTGGMGDGNGVLKTVELYDPSTEKWRNVGSMNYPRYCHTATVLTNGKVLVVGGIDSDVLNSTELFDPSTETWTATGSMNTERFKHTASLLRDGKVLVAGGSTGGDVTSDENAVKTAEIYDPSTGMWTNTNSMHYTRSWHTASVLENGNVLVVGGNMDDETSAHTPELYNSSTNTYIPFYGLKNIQYLHQGFGSTNEDLLRTDQSDSMKFNKAKEH